MNCCSRAQDFATTSELDCEPALFSLLRSFLVLVRSCRWQIDSATGNAFTHCRPCSSVHSTDVSNVDAAGQKMARVKVRRKVLAHFGCSFYGIIRAQNAAVSMARFESRR